MRVGAARRFFEENPARKHCRESDRVEWPLFGQRGIAEKGVADAWGMVRPGLSGVVGD
jgi:hypothetical protein